MNANTIVSAVPEGYRLATLTEVRRAQHPAYFTRMVKVENGILSGWAIKSTVDTPSNV